MSNKEVPPSGRHMIVDLWGELDSLPFWNMDEAARILKNAARLAGATVLTERWHHFGDGHGYTGVIVLSESHISVHTWPEDGFAALDVFMCGESYPIKTLTPILEFYKATDHAVTMFDRGIKKEG